MTLTTIGNVSRYYAETLVLLFFPGSKFPEDGSGGAPYITLELLYENSGKLTGRATIEAGGRTETADYSPSADTVSRNTLRMAEQLAVGGAMILAGEKFCGFRPPWGALTGVRPAKLAMRMIDRNFDEKALCEDCLCTPEKAKIAMLTAETERKFLTDENRKKCSLYIAIPFCPTKCAYCSFVSFSSERLLSMIPDYVERLLIDIENTVKIINELGLKIETVYIGGGTPTTLNEYQLSRLLDKIGECTDIENLAEFTVEAGRPDTINAAKMKILKDAGVTRVSVNAQTMNGEVLKNIGRHHTPEDFLRAYGEAKASGIRDINVDLIAGLPGESLDSFKNSVDKIISLDPSNITVHTFYVKRAAELARREPDVCRAEDETVRESVSYADRALLSAGYVPYYLYRQKNTAANLENTGFSKSGHEGLYNIYMMEEVHTVFGAGASAMTKFVSPGSDEMKIVRISETKYPYEYLDGTKNSAEKRFSELRLAALDFYGKTI